ncbi:MAG TPA: hypothetical protein VG796_06415 [Verrucomicrobiales bacterium]|jgi:hypothetical protein|nr:hypothetical protein [Verrucomicrobiales bacterium]
MSPLALEIEETLQRLDAPTAVRLERLVRDVLHLVRPSGESRPNAANGAPRIEWLQKLDRLRGAVGTGKKHPSTDEIIDDLRSERC